MTPENKVKLLYKHSNVVARWLRDHQQKILYRRNNYYSKDLDLDELWKRYLFCLGDGQLSGLLHKASPMPRFTNKYEVAAVLDRGLEGAREVCGVGKPDMQRIFNRGPAHPGSGNSSFRDIQQKLDVRAKLIDGLGLEVLDNGD